MWPISFPWLEDVPATFWGVIAGSLFTLLGVFLSNRAQAHRLARQLEHDRELKREDRLLALRRDVYLPAAEAVSAGLMLIGRLSDLSMSQEGLLGDWIEKAPAIAKANLIADASTVEALTRFNTELGALILRLLSTRAPLVGRQQHASLLLEEINRFSAERDRMVDLLKEMNLSGAYDDRRQAAIDSNFQYNQRRIDEVLKEHGERVGALLDEQMQFTKDCQRASAELTRLLVPLLACVRAELRLPFDAETYLRITEESQERLAASLDDFIISARHGR
jgi:hypothetical protein